MTIANSDLRRAPRRRVLMEAMIISAEGTQRARINDLTQAGARISCRRLLKQDQDVIFSRGQLFVAAPVAWAAGANAGLEFYRHLPAPVEALTPRHDVTE
jgi:hypothetical protein